jgi:hypothetical protein
MSAEQRLTSSRERDSAQDERPHSYFVGHREFEAAEVYEVTVRGVKRLRSRRLYGDASLDWHGSETARMELSYLLISRITKERPSRDLQSRLALYVLGRLPDGGFVLDVDDLSRWIRVAGDGHYSGSAHPAPRLWVGRVRRGLGRSDNPRL